MGRAILRLAAHKVTLLLLSCLGANHKMIPQITLSDYSLGISPLFLRKPGHERSLEAERNSFFLYTAPTVALTAAVVSSTLLCRELCVCVLSQSLLTKLPPPSFARRNGICLFNPLRKQERLNHQKCILSILILFM